MSERKDARQAESLLVVGERWQSTGKADAATDQQPRAIAGDGLDSDPASADAAKPTPYWKRSPWWYWT